MSETFIAGVFGGLVAATATTLGALPSLGRPGRGTPLLHISLDFALGMMLAAAAFSMIGPAGLSALAKGPEAMLAVLASIVGGVLFIAGVGKLLARGASTLTLQEHGAWLFIIAMMLHNFPEGLASGAAWAGLSWKQGLPILAAIALQNLPEGLMTALAFRAMGASPRMAFMGAFASAVVEFVGGGAGGLLLSWVDSVLPFVLGFAGGAMLFVSIREVKERFAADTLSRVKASRDLAMGAAMTVAITLLFG